MVFSVWCAWDFLVLWVTASISSGCSSAACLSSGPAGVPRPSVTGAVTAAWCRARVGPAAAPQAPASSPLDWRLFRQPYCSSPFGTCGCHLRSSVSVLFSIFHVTWGHAHVFLCGFKCATNFWVIWIPLLTPSALLFEGLFLSFDFHSD